MRELPTGWVFTELEQLAADTKYPIGDGDHGQISPKSYSNSGIPYIRVRDIGWGKFEPKAMVYITDDVHNRNLKSELIPGDILIAKTGATIGKCCIIPNYIERANTSSSVGKVSVEKKVTLPKWVLFYFLSKEFLNQMWAVSQKTAQPGFSIREMKRFIIPIAPLNEQYRIVVKLEEILTKIDDCSKRLEKIPLIIKRFRRSVLAAACSGRLTTDWRKKNVSCDANKILERIINRRCKNKDSKGRFKAIYSYKEEGDSDNLPKGWEYIALDKLCESFQYGTSSKSDKTGKVAVLRMGNIQNGRIDWTDLVYTSDDNEIRKYLLKPNDVLFNRTNSPELVGKSAIYKGEQPAIFAGYLIRINNLCELDSDYLNICLNSNYAKEYCYRVKTDGVSQSNINAKKLGKFEIPLCSLEEQQEIVRRVESLFKLADQVEERYTKAKAYLDKLIQSVLAKAFRGELVPQDPSDEPASVLLERIKQEKAKLEVEKKPQKVNRKQNPPKRKKAGSDEKNS